LAAAPDRPNIEIRRGPDGKQIVVLQFPYDPHIVALVRQIPHRRFDWDTREWWAPVDDWAAVHVAEVLRRFPRLTSSAQTDIWLRGVGERWVGRVRTTRYDGRGWWVLDTRAGTVPEALLKGSVEHDGLLLAPLTQEGAEALADARGAKLDGAAMRCVLALEHGQEAPPARLVLNVAVEGESFLLETLWDPSIGDAFERLPGTSDGGRSLPLDPWVIDHLDGFLALHGVAIDAPAESALEDLREEAAEAQAQIKRSKATEGPPLEGVAERMGGELQPFQWAGVQYLLDARRAFLSDEQGLGKTVQALATMEADEAFPAIVVCPASLKLNWLRETKKWLPHRTVEVVEGGVAVPKTGDITIINYEVVGKHFNTLARLRPEAVIVDESHYCKNPRAKRTQAVRKLAESVVRGGLRVALTGTPVLNHAEELISQLRIIGRLDEFGSGARFSRQFQGVLTEERLHWHLRRSCFVRRLKSEVLPQLPAKRRTVVPVALDNEREYRVAERDVVEWLRSQPLELGDLNAKIAATLRAERLAQLGALQRLAARGKLNSALAWIHDFLASGEPLVVFARHREIQEAVLERFPDALHLFGRDRIEAREESVRAFQEPGGPQLIVCATRVAAQGITLTRASNVAFLELEWTPALHDQAEDRTHRIGQTDSVTAWYLLAAETIDETMAELVERKRGIVDAVTDGKRINDENVVEGLVRVLRGSEPYQHLRPVA
jgi:SWI/SNF-related matrix-associated actin-dependent regulator of chromatin subfamily A-like protein 1